MMELKGEQFYHTCHDYANYHVERQFGPRTLTLVLCLNDVGEDGATEFPTVGVQVSPRKNKALTWPVDPERKCAAR